MNDDPFLVLKLSPTDQAHVCAALQDYRRRLQANGTTMPPALIDMIANVAQRSIEGHRGSNIGGIPVEADPSPVTPDMVTLAQAAQQMTCSLSTVKRRIHDGDLTAVRHGRVLRIRRDEVARYLDGRTITC